MPVNKLLKCFTSLIFSSPWHFISHGVPSSLKASFESINGTMNFSHGIRAHVLNHLYFSFSFFFRPLPRMFSAPPLLLPYLIALSSSFDLMVLWIFVFIFYYLCVFSCLYLFRDSQYFPDLFTIGFAPVYDQKKKKCLRRSNLFCSSCLCVFPIFLLPNGRVTLHLCGFLVLSFPSMLSMAFSLPAQIHTAPPSTQVYHSPTSPWLASLTHPAFQSRRALSTFSADIPQPRGAATCWPSPASFHPPEARLSFPLLLRCEETKSVFWCEEMKTVFWFNKKGKEKCLLRLFCLLKKMMREREREREREKKKM
jgi:hypothetical protein